MDSTIEVVATQYIGLGTLDVLTRRELEVLVLLGHGLSVPRAAAILHRSPKTVERHKDSISKKLRLRGQAKLVGVATSVGLDLVGLDLVGLDLVGLDLVGLDLSDIHLRRFKAWCKVAYQA
ncbi:Bacterial regulatory protein, luxR family [Novipirellula aureliae]|uniref:Bacterial regulatory protein, luxR family n=1 Tax=Novipirellula aureliae TaxID=2527966 RepID=A0A5C6E8K9_9BACT|nr:helix-turn-helix transcriptional regulator [Novipirellula aureliae]TWU45170.1 Bacterial regulatory protein, luxR family [Novipirellula aureliae]